MSIPTGRARPAPWIPLALAALASLFAFTSTPSAEAAEPEPIGFGAGADWGIKASFRSYIAGPIANGSTEVADGASINPDSTFHFPIVSGSFDPEAGSTVVQLGGSVHFSGHDGQLDLRIWSPRVEITAEGAALYAEVTSRSLEEGAAFVHYANAKLANLDISAATPAIDATTTTWSALPAALDPEGVAPFAGFYGAGTALDPFTFGYEGPGGKPVAEEWTAPGTPLLGLAATGTVHTGVGHLAIGPGGRVWASSYDGGSLAVLDGGSLATIDTVAVESELRNVAVDKAADTAYGINTSIRRITGASGTPTLDPTPIPMGVGIASNELAVRESDGALFTTYGFALHRFTPVAGGGWDHDSWENYENQRVKMGPDGRLYLYGSSISKVTFQGTDEATITPLPDTAGAGNLAIADDGTLAWLKLDASAYPVITSELVEMHPDGSGGYTTETHPAEEVWGSVATAISADGDRFIASDRGGTKFVVFDDGERVATISNGSNVANDVAIADNGTAYMSWRDGRVGKLGQVGTSPAVTAQPVDAEVRLAAADGGATASFAAAASGEPAPSLQWQSRAPGATRWSDIEGETSPELGVAATQATSGTRYRAVFTNAAGTIASEPATLRVVVSTPGETPPTDGGDGGGGGDTPAGRGGGGEASAPVATPTTATPSAQPFRLATPRRVVLTRGGAAVVAKVECAAAQACLLRAPKQVRLRADGKSYAASVVAPRRVAPGGRATVRLRVAAPTRAALAGRRVEARFRLRLSTPGTVRKSIVHPVLVFPGEPRGSGRQA
ncbi:MAG: HtaA domain-containing protein [Actinobacteria bacterium]|nr:HtaA domain-containing protein [Actinomycetota bacterium]